MHCHQEEDRKSEASLHKPSTKLARWQATGQPGLSYGMFNCKPDGSVNLALFREPLIVSISTELLCFSTSISCCAAL